ncbi:unnamed protein product [Ranitomeya imitator]|uniref:Reverse transcriptase domain-containing protein n=1 Tax=Ranitomeya imitator TaxID=111125 RepID=A0ABN9MMR0_9NEOB|nr:unnamed protein product [Ranitomeya imitator]
MYNLDSDLIDFLLVLLRFILTHNCFIFNKRVYLQKQGTAMGASCAPSYANLFLGAWERDIFISNPIPGIDSVHHWMRYIDDVWFIWEGPRHQLESLMAVLNNNNLNIKLTYKAGRNLDFLDLQNDLLYKNNHGNDSEENYYPCLIATYNNKWPQFCQIVRKHWQILLTDPILKKCLPPSPLITARRAKNLKDIMVHSHYEPTKEKKGTWLDTKGFYPCGHCKACENMPKSQTFTDAKRSRTYSIRHYISCATKGVVYCAHCPCGKIYIGLTTRELRIRTREHVRDIDRSKTVDDPSVLKTIPRHFFEHHNSNSSLLRIKGIDIVQMGSRGGNLAKNLARLESKWIYRLGSIAPQGLNENFGFSAFLD